MSVQQEQCGSKAKSMCQACALFYGSEATEGLCSACYKKNKPSKKEEIVLPSPVPSGASTLETDQCIADIEDLSLQPKKKVQTDTKRCFDCNKKIGLLGISCKCGYMFCNGHRLPEDHQCEFDHKGAGREKLRKENFKVYNGKLKEI